MLVISRKPGQTIQVGHNISITVVRIGDNITRIGITAPRSVVVLRGELAEVPPEINDDELAESMFLEVDLPLEGVSVGPIIGSHLCGQFVSDPNDVSTMKVGEAA